LSFCYENDLTLDQAFDEVFERNGIEWEEEMD
jgi:hypothetical protein